jgi:hypothetical protein
MGKGKEDVDLLTIAWVEAGLWQRLSLDREGMIWREFGQFTQTQNLSDFCFGQKRPAKPA